MLKITAIINMFLVVHLGWLNCAPLPMELTHDVASTNEVKLTSEMESGPSALLDAKNSGSNVHSETMPSKLTESNHYSAGDSSEGLDMRSLRYVNILDRLRSSKERLGKDTSPNAPETVIDHENDQHIQSLTIKINELKQAPDEAALIKIAGNALGEINEWLDSIGGRQGQLAQQLDSLDQRVSSKEPTKHTK